MITYIKRLYKRVNQREVAHKVIDCNKCVNAAQKVTNSMPCKMCMHSCIIVSHYKVEGTPL
jgi:hypothetical protein